MSNKGRWIAGIGFALMVLGSGMFFAESSYHVEVMLGALIAAVGVGMIAFAGLELLDKKPPSDGEP